MVIYLKLFYYFVFDVVDYIEKDSFLSRIFTSI